ncbi:MAG: trehalose-phosphatase [Elusimicrobiales bacterium]|nr:trehalose-phosphatase [Elusimicrobiales bacterium]
MDRIVRELFCRTGASRGPGRLCLMLDFDGTLSEMAPTPEKARFYPPSRRALDELSRLPGVTVALVSGRDVSDLRRKAGLGRAVYCGNHGLELPGFRLPADVEAAKKAFRRSSLPALRLLREISSRYPGSRIQRKRFSISLHYRALRPVAALAMERELGEAARALARMPGVRTGAGKKVLEVKAKADFHKGAACRLILERRGGAGLYMGDDVTDEDAFRSLRGRAVTVFVGPRSRRTAAMRRVPDPRSAAALLEKILEAAGRGG